MSGDDLIDIVRLLAACLDSQYKSDQKVAKDAIIEILEDKPIIVRDLDGNVLDYSDNLSLSDEETMCKGSWLLRTACGICSKCKNSAYASAKKLNTLEDVIRWRDTAKELPTQDGPYLVMSTSSEFPIVNYWHSELSDWTVGPWQYWRPLGPVAGDEL